jgi:hypothetical protein
MTTQEAINCIKLRLRRKAEHQKKFSKRSIYPAVLWPEEWAAIEHLLAWCETLSDQEAVESERLCATNYAAVDQACENLRKSVIK